MLCIAIKGKFYVAVSNRLILKKVICQKIGMNFNSNGLAFCFFHFQICIFFLIFSEKRTYKHIIFDGNLKDRFCVCEIENWRMDSSASASEKQSSQSSGNEKTPNSDSRIHPYTKSTKSPSLQAFYSFEEALAQFRSHFLTKYE